MRKRKTIQQQLVIDALDSLRNHPTAQDIYNKISEQYKDISIATVYSNLKALVMSGQIRVLSVPGGADRYESNLTEHAHICCICCGEFRDIPLTGLNEIDSQIAGLSGYDVRGHEMLFRGICPRCKENAQTGSPHIKSET